MLSPKAVNNMLILETGKRDSQLDNYIMIETEIYIYVCVCVYNFPFIYLSAG